MSKHRKKPKTEMIGVIRPTDMIPYLPDKLNKGTDAIVRQGTGVHESKQRKAMMKKKTTRQYLSEYGRAMRNPRIFVPYSECTVWLFS